MREPFHDAFDAALSGQAGALDPWLRSEAGSPAGLAVYRNTAAKARADALAALFPTVERLVGGEWFRKAALAFAEVEPPGQPVMDDYGEGFPGWLARFKPARVLPFLAPVARLDRAWSLAHRAVDSPTLDTAIVRWMEPRALFAAHARLHPSVQLFWFDWTVPSIWLANRAGAELGQSVAWQDTPEGLVILRPAMTVVHECLTRPEWAFLNACRRGATLGGAAAEALKADHKADLSQIFARLLNEGVFNRLEPEPVQ